MRRAGLLVVARDEAEYTACEITHVHMSPLSPIAIAAYVASGEPEGKAGGYAIQGLAGAFITSVNGSYFNVVGLPLYETLSLLRGSGFRHPETPTRE